MYPIWFDCFDGITVNGNGFKVVKSIRSGEQELACSGRYIDEDVFTEYEVEQCVAYTHIVGAQHFAIRIEEQSTDSGIVNAWPTNLLHSFNVNHIHSVVAVGGKCVVLTNNLTTCIDC